MHACMYASSICCSHILLLGRSSTKTAATEDSKGSPDKLSESKGKMILSQKMINWLCNKRTKDADDNVKKRQRKRLGRRVSNGTEAIESVKQMFAKSSLILDFEL